MTPDTSGPGSPTPFAFYDRDSSCWRTSQATFLSDSTPCSLTLPKRGSMRSGSLYALPMSGPATDAPDSSLLPTPAVNDMGEGKSVEAWDDWTEAMREKHGNGNGHGRSLAIEAARLLPTPNTMDAMPERSDEALARGKEAGGCHNLKDVLPRLLPTPTSMDGHSSGSSSPEPGVGHGLTLTDVAARGVTTDPRSAGMSSPSDDPHQPRLWEAS